MPKIIIMNQGTGHARGYDPLHSEPLRKSVGRCTWLASQGDVIISPIPIERGFLCSVASTLGFDVNSVSIIVMDHLRAEGLFLSETDIRRIKEIVTEHGEWSVMPCFWTPDVASFAEQMGLGSSVTLAFAGQRGTELFNRKQHFRQIAAGASVPIPEGSIVHSVEDLDRAIERHLRRTGTIIVKKDDSAGGLGNITVTTGPVKALPGSRITCDYKDDRAQAGSLWEELTDSDSHSLVVEVYHDIIHSFYFEYFIGDDALPVYLHSGDIRLQSPDDANTNELVWLGLDTPTSIPHSSLVNALSISYRLVELIAQLGCRGHINIDAIITTDGELLFNESNLRWGGGTSLHTIGQHLLGENFADENELSLVRGVHCPSRSETVQIMNEHALHFSHDTQEGVIILAADEHMKGTMECLIIGQNRQRVRELESKLCRVLNPVREADRELCEVLN